MPSPSLEKIRRLQAGAQSLLDERPPAPQDPERRPRLHRFVLFWVMVGRSFVRNRCPVRASALAYASLLAMVPMLAVTISVSSSLLKKEGEDRIEEFIEWAVASLTPGVSEEVGGPLARAKAAAEKREVTARVQEFGGAAAADSADQFKLRADRFAQWVSTHLKPEAGPPQGGGPGKINPAKARRAGMQRAAGFAQEIRGLPAGQRDAATERFLDWAVTSVKPPVTVDLKDLPEATAKAVAARKEIAHRINEFVQNIRSGTLGATGMVALLFVAITMLTRIENTFNDIWGVTRGRSWLARVLQYWATLTLGPVLLVVAVALTSGPQFQGVKDYLGDLPLGGGKAIAFGFRFLPFLILCLGFALFYQLMPNAPVQWRAALMGGLVGGALWQINSVVSVLYVSRVVTNSKIYGSLGMVPVFMVGLYLSWTILLFGAQVAYGWQNRRAYAQEKQIEAMSQTGREFAALRVMTLVGQAFHRGEKAATGNEIAAALRVPTRLVSQLLQALLRARLLVEVQDREPGFAPARPLEQITAHDVLAALRGTDADDSVAHKDGTRRLVRGEFETILDAERAAAEKVTLRALVDRSGQAGAGGGAGA